MTSFNNRAVRILLFSVLMLSISYATPQSQTIEQSSANVSEEIISSETLRSNLIREICGLGTTVTPVESALSLIPDMEQSYHEMVLHSSSGHHDGVDYLTMVIVMAVVLLVLYLVTYDYGPDKEIKLSELTSSR